MTGRFVLGVFVGFLAAAHSGTYAQDRGGSDDAAAAAKKLEGNWKLVRAEAGGQAQLAGLRKEGLFIEEGKIFWTEDGRERGGQKGDLEIDPSTKPKSFVVEITRGSLIGQKLLAIYEINGKKLNICWSEPDAKKQPTRFVTKTSTGAGARLETYELVDDDDSTASEGTTSKNGSGKVDVAAETKKLEGNWKLTRKEYKGNLWPGAGKDGLFIEEGKIFWTNDGQERGGQKGDVTIDPTTSPKSIEVEVTRGSSIGKKLLGIYEIKGNKLTICWSEPGGEKRPKKFVTKMAVGAGAMLETYQAVEEEKSAASATTGAPKGRGGKVDVVAEMKKLEGTWKLTRREEKGNLRPGADRGNEGLFIEEGKIFWTRNGKESGGQRGDVTIDPSTSPMSIEVEVTRGSSIGKKLLGIYEFKGKKLTICWSDPGGEKRPKKFVTKMSIGAGSTLDTYQKVED
jgi:uncharacterized protein (TIGR03067 family)